jgi:signal transduction histidine kinase
MSASPRPTDAQVLAGRRAQPRPRDTVVRWIALTIALAMGAALALNFLFVELAGVWGRPPLTQVGLLEQVAAITRVVDAAPAELREGLARAATNPGYTVRWHRAREETGTPPADPNDRNEPGGIVRDLLGDPARRVESFEPDDWSAPRATASYTMLVQLRDDTWLAFSTPSRSWGLDPGMRNLIVAALVLLSTLGVAAVATRRLALPLQRFARAARRFASDFRAPPIALTGPHEIRQAAIAFNAMQAQIQHFVADRTQMLAAISHDLRAPLTRMRLRGEFIDDPEQQQKLFRDVDEMQDMISAALAFFRDDARLEEATPFDLSELLMTLVDDFRDQGVAIAFEGPRGVVYAGRPLGIKRALVNLLENAVKYGRQPRIDLVPHAGNIEIRVSDRGPGVPDDLLEQVFMPFYRVDTSRHRSTGGVGLGLSAARAIVREHGGELQLRNRKGGGLEARMTLPQA